MLTQRLFLSCARSYMNQRTIAENAAISKRILVIQRVALHSRKRSTKICNSKDTKDLQCIYTGSMASRMKAVKVFSLMSSSVGLAAQPILLEQGMKLGGTPMAVFFCGSAAFFTFVTPFLLHLLTKRYVTEIHYDRKADEYTATTISLLLRKVQTKFRVDDVKVPDVPGMFTSFCVDKRALLVDPLMFTDTEHYVRIMGYDKPIDFKLNLDEVVVESKENVDANAETSKKQI